MRPKLAQTRRLRAVESSASSQEWHRAGRLLSLSGTKGWDLVLTVKGESTKGSGERMEGKWAEGVLMSKSARPCPSVEGQASNWLKLV